MALNKWKKLELKIWELNYVKRRQRQCEKVNMNSLPSSIPTHHPSRQKKKRKDFLLKVCCYLRKAKVNCVVDHRKHKWKLYLVACNLLLSSSETSFLFSRGRRRRRRWRKGGVWKKKLLPWGKKKQRNIQPRTMQVFISSSPSRAN